MAVAGMLQGGLNMAENQVPAAGVDPRLNP